MRRELNALQLHSDYYKPLMPLANFIFSLLAGRKLDTPTCG